MSRLPRVFLAAAAAAAALLAQTASASDDSSSSSSSSNYNSWCNDRASQSCPATGQILSDLSCGWCRSWTFSANIIDTTLRVIGLDGGALPGDGDNKHTYLVSADLSTHFAMADLRAWKLSPIPSLVWNTQDGALWSDHNGTSLFRYGGHSLGAPVADSNELSRYDIASSSWSTTDSASQVPRYTGGAPVNIPELGLAFYIGGSATKAVTLDSSVADGNQHYQTQMIKLDTWSARGSLVDAPFLPVQFGAATYIPIGVKQQQQQQQLPGPENQGVLIYFGGESPSSDVVPISNNATVANPWDHVWIYDIGGDRWYRQSTTGLAQARTEFCSATMYDEATRSWQIWVMGGADFETKSIISSVSVLSIPSFQWFEAADVPASTPPRMSLECQQFGPQIFALGGRTEDTDWGGQDFDSIGYLYDTNLQTTVATFDPSPTSYTAPQTLRDAISATEYPATWGDKAISALFVARETISSRPSSAPAGSVFVNVQTSSPTIHISTTASPTSLGQSSEPSATASPTSLGQSSAPSATASPAMSSGTIAAAVVSAIFGLTLVLLVVYVLLRRRRVRLEEAEKAARYRSAEKHGWESVNKGAIAELSANVGELSAGAARWELQGSKVVA